MKKIKIRLEYRCFPIWLYDEKDNFINNDLPNRLLNDKDIEQQCIELQKNFDELYLDNGIDFKYIGFNDSDEKKEFLNKITSMELNLQEKVGFDFEIENDVKLEDL